MKLKAAFILMICLFSCVEAVHVGCKRYCKRGGPRCCYQKCIEYCPEYVDIPECSVCPEVKHRRLKRYALKHYQQKFVKYVPQYYTQTIAKYEPEYYYETYTVYHKKGSKRRCCTMVPTEVYRPVKCSQNECDENNCLTY